MDAALWPSFLMWCAIFNYGLLLLGFFGFVVFHDPMYRLHRRWFVLSASRFDATAYLLLGLYKIGIWMFLIVPYLVLCFVRYTPYF
mgnify:CR=1 FL=1